jgi:hypothetical protein
MDILDQEHGIRGEVRVELLERSDLLAHGVPTVLDEDIDRSDLCRKGPQELPVLLITDEHLDAPPSEPGAARVDVDATDRCLAAEVVTPHLERATLVDAELEDHDRPAPKAFEVTVVDVEVVNPLVDLPTAVRAEVALERILGPTNGGSENMKPSTKPQDAPTDHGLAITVRDPTGGVARGRPSR